MPVSTNATLLRGNDQQQFFARLALLHDQTVVITGVFKLTFAYDENVLVR